MTEVLRAVSQNPLPLIGPKLIFAAAEGLRVDALGGTDLDPDAFSEHYAYDLGGYLKMLGHLHGWFEDGSLRLPAQEPVGSGLLEDRSAILLAEAWNQLDDHWGRIRYFEGSSLHTEQRSYRQNEVAREIANISVHEAVSVLALDMCYGLSLTTYNTEDLGLRLLSGCVDTHCCNCVASGK